MTNLESFLLGEASHHLGHAAVATFPDQPFLNWQVNFEKARPNNGCTSCRDNPATYLNACEKMHDYFCAFKKKHYASTCSSTIPFSKIKQQIDEILRSEGNKDERSERWTGAIGENRLYDTDKDENERIEYSLHDWENQKARFHEGASSGVGTKLEVYKFHQAAMLHRSYVLKELLPSHGIAVY